MPIYIIEHPSALLTLEQKKQICNEITRIHCAITNGIAAFVNVVFHATDDNVEFINNKLRHQARILGRIRGGRSAVTRESLITQISDAWTTIVGERCHLIGLDEMDAENIAEDGIMMPDPGKEIEWLAKNQKIFEERAERGEETSQDLLAELKAKPFKK